MLALWLHAEAKKHHQMVISTTVSPSTQVGAIHVLLRRVGSEKHLLLPPPRHFIQCCAPSLLFLACSHATHTSDTPLCLFSSYSSPLYPLSCCSTLWVMSSGLLTVHIRNNDQGRRHREGRIYSGEGCYDDS